MTKKAQYVYSSNMSRMMLNGYINLITDVSNVVKDTVIMARTDFSSDFTREKSQ